MLQTLLDVAGGYNKTNKFPWNSWEKYEKIIKTIKRMINSATDCI